MAQPGGLGGDTMGSLLYSFTPDSDGQAFYDTATKFRAAGPMWEGCPEWAFTETKRYLVDHAKIYEWSADEGGLGMFSDWLPVTK